MSSFHSCIPDLFNGNNLLFQKVRKQYSAKVCKNIKILGN